MYLFSGKKIKVNIKYEENNAQFDLHPYDTLSHLKVVISRFFPQITFDPILYHQKKIINEYSDLTRISELSHGKNILSLHIVKPLRPKSPIILKESNQFNYYSQHITNTNLIEITSDSNPNSKLNKNLNCKCLQLPIDYYCSKCHEFLCAKCQEESHIGHKSIIFDLNSIDESVKLFAISLQAEISNELSKYKDIEGMFKENLLIDFQSWKEMIIRKLDKIEGFFHSFEEFEAIFQTKYSTIEKMSLEASNKIEKMMTDFTSSSKGYHKDNFNKAKDVCNELTNSVEMIDFLQKENMTRKEEFDTNNKINEMFKELDKTIDKLEMLSRQSYEEIRKRTENEMAKTRSMTRSFSNEKVDNDGEMSIRISYNHKSERNKGQELKGKTYSSGNNLQAQSQEYNSLAKSITERANMSKTKTKIREGKSLNKVTWEGKQSHTQGNSKHPDSSNEHNVITHRNISHGKKKLLLPQIQVMMTKDYYL